jgi:hypothetical protein
MWRYFVCFQSELIEPLLIFEKNLLCVQFAYCLMIELNRLTTFRSNNRMGYLPTGKAGVLPIYRKNCIHVLVDNVLASCLLAILANVCQQLSHFRA